VVLKQKGVSEWITKHANASLEELRHAKKEGITSSIRVPSIWVCTGVDLISDARVLTGSSTTSSLNGFVSIDIGLLLGGPPIGQSAFVVGGSRDNTQYTQQVFGHEDERVWAAQFFQLYIEREPGKLQKLLQGRIRSDVEHSRVPIIKLREIEDLGASAVRSDFNTISSEAVPKFHDTAQVVGFELGDGAVLDTDSQEDAQNSDIRDDDVNDEFYSRAVEGINWEEYGSYLDYLHAIEEREKRRKLAGIPTTP
jgi:hypothetical protein